MTSHPIHSGRSLVASLTLLISLAANLIIAADGHAQESVAVKSGEKIAFLGDSITQGGAASPCGYVRLVISGLKANGIDTVPIPAGIGGHKSNDMLARLDRDVLSKKPDWMTLSCGVNDVWHGAKGVPLEDYKKNITAIVDQTLAANVKVVILTATMIGEDQPNANNQKLIAYNEFLRELAKEKKCRLADLNADMQAEVATRSKTPHVGHLLTTDGVHMNPQGNVMMATGVLKAFGLDEAQIKKARAAWLDMPHAVDVSGSVSLTLRQYQQLCDLAGKRKCGVNDVVSAEATQSVQSLLKSESRE